MNPPEQFIARWKNNPLSERAGAQAHFDDLCDLLGVAKAKAYQVKQVLLAIEKLEGMKHER